ncbi:histidine--tRNA ligase [Jatrophihabitans sp.]|uniref:histidine--tRNA ligase n=1 Tax=Jatrophihabitans sp. TaxID=1932789 RepID=UPI002C99E598|nr:histidine--tRNA ligase [Jatrophihabitans sp.]
MTAAKPTPLSGFPELLPAERFVELRVLDSLRASFELHGFAPIETRAAEPLEQLLRKGEIDKEVYLLRRLQAGESAGADGAEDGSALGLHFDLTVPFARYVLENAGKLEFPFRRYQIQKVWRGERPQEGRYREFTQADIDVVARDVLPFHHDVEVARVMAEALARLPVPALKLQVNNRKLIEGFYLTIGISNTTAVMRVIDKIDKVPAGVLRSMLTDEAGISGEQAELAIRFASLTTSDGGQLGFGISELVPGMKWHDLLGEGVAELRTVVDGCASLNSDRFTVVADLSIARGLDYYTGTVFETRMAGFESLGSICSGGRYDSLASDGRTSYPGVGISLGVTRMLLPLFSRKKLTASRSVPSAVLVALPDEESRATCDAIAAQLRANGIATEVAAAAQRYGKQIRYAERRGIPFVWFPAGEDNPHEVKDIRTGEQQQADPATWQPPAEDLRPQVVRPGAEPIEPEAEPVEPEAEPVEPEAGPVDPEAEPRA